MIKFSVALSLLLSGVFSLNAQVKHEFVSADNERVLASHTSGAKNVSVSSGTVDTILSVTDEITPLQQTIQGESSVRCDAPQEMNIKSVLDGKFYTKYFNSTKHGNLAPGVNSGFEVAPECKEVVTAFQFATARDRAQRDPLQVTIEGSHSEKEAGRKYVLLYKGQTGLDTDPGRKCWGNVVEFKNSEPYKYYRVLITKTRQDADGTEYSGFRLGTKHVPGTINVFLVGGQSNAVGRASSAGLPESLKKQRDVIFNGRSNITFLQAGDSFGPEITFGRNIADYYAPKNERVALLKYAVGASNLFEQWKADGTKDSGADGKLYAHFQKTINGGLSMLKSQYPDDHIKIQGMIWMQGESDSSTIHNTENGVKRSLEYGNNLKQLIKDLRLNYGSDLLFVIGKLSSEQKKSGEEVYRNIVRSLQEEVALNDPLTGIVVTDDFSLKPDQLHFNTEGQQSLGKGFALEMIKLINDTQN